MNNTLDQAREERPDCEVMALEIVSRYRDGTIRAMNHRHIFKPKDTDPLCTDLDLYEKEGIIGYILRPSTYDDALHWSEGWPKEIPI